LFTSSEIQILYNGHSQTGENLIFFQLIDSDLDSCLFSEDSLLSLPNFILRNITINSAACTCVSVDRCSDSRRHSRSTYVEKTTSLT